jgi:hypothetical protein
MKWFIRLAIVAAIVGVIVLVVTRRQRSPMPEIEYAAPPSDQFRSEAVVNATKQAEVVAEEDADAVEEAVEEAEEAEEADDA